MPTRVSPRRTLCIQPPRLRDAVMVLIMTITASCLDLFGRKNERFSAAHHAIQTGRLLWNIPCVSAMSHLRLTSDDITK